MLFWWRKLELEELQQFEVCMESTNQALVCILAYSRRSPKRLLMHFFFGETGSLEIVLLVWIADVFGFQ